MLCHRTLKSVLNCGALVNSPIQTCLLSDTSVRHLGWETLDSEMENAQYDDGRNASDSGTFHRSRQGH